MEEFDWTCAADMGLYTVPMAARLLAAKQNKVRSWIEGYPSSDAEPILSRDLPKVGGKTVLSFLDLVEGAFIRHFLAIGYSPQTIRRVSLKLRERHLVDHPFAMNKRFKADGKHIFEEVVSDAGEQKLVNLMNDNFEIVSVIEPSLFDQIFYVEDVARQWTPLVAHPRVVINPKMSFGRPVLKDLWVPTEKLFRAYVNEGSAEAAASEWDVTPDDVLAATMFERDLEHRTLQ
ncbi:hypothetical protein [Brevundimonas sp. PWP3-1b1]|uniref:hypothetical protein n=1 Tax=unclassified Brevundimonas TaxID=2622653 RepID=UPI003CF69287